MDSSLDNAPGFYFSFKDRGELVAVNKTACDALGYDRAELEGHLIDKIFPVASRIFFQTHWFPMLRLTQTADELFVIFLKKDKSELPVLLNSKRFETTEGMLIGCIGIIVKNRVKYEEELIAANKAYQAAMSTNAALLEATESLANRTEKLDISYSKLENQHKELQQINKILSHDLQEPVRKLLYFTDALREHLEILPEDVIKKFERVQSVGRQLKSRFSTLQQYVWSIKEDAPFTIVNLNDVVIAARKEIQEHYGENAIEIKAENLPGILGNASQLTAMFNNLFDNALRFSVKGRQPVVSVRAIFIERNHFKSLAGEFRYTDHLRLMIEDNGVGIDESLHEQVFSLFYSLNNPEGAGMGLALCRKIVEHHRGNISLQSSPGIGTTVTITLPID